MKLKIKHVSSLMSEQMNTLKSIIFIISYILIAGIPVLIIFSDANACAQLIAFQISLAYFSTILIIRELHREKT